MKSTRSAGKPSSGPANFVAGAAVVLALLVLFGWAADLPLLTSVSPNWRAMQPLTAVGFLLAGLGLYCFAARRWRALPWLLLPLIAMSAGALFQHWSGRSLGIDALLFPAGVLDQAPIRYPGRMAEITAIEFLLFALFLAWPRRTPRLYRGASRIATLGLLIGLVGLAGYFLGVRDLARVGSYTAMAAHTALGFVLLFTGALLAQRDPNWLHLLLDSSMGGRLARRLLYHIVGWSLALGLTIPIVAPMIVEQRLEVAIYALALAVVLVVAALRFAKHLRHSDAQRDRAMAALATARTQLAGVLESALDAVVTIDEAQRIVFFNPAAERVFGCPAAEAVGAPIERFIPERFRTAHAEHVRRFGQTGVTSRPMGHAASLRALRSDGAEFPVEASISQIRVGTQKYLTVFLRDITERKQAEEQLRASEEKYRTLFANMTEGFVLGEPILDERGQAVDIRFLEANEAFYRQIGISGDIRGRPVRDYLPLPERSWIDRFAAVALTGRAERFENFNADTKRHYEVYVYRPSPGRFAVLGRDISAQKRMEQALRESERRLNLALAAGNSAVWEMHVATGIIIGSDSLYAMYGYAPGELKTLADWAALVHDDDRPGIAEKIDAAIQGQADGYSFEARLRCKDGTWRWNLSEALVAERDTRGRAVRVVGTHSDIDARKRAEEALRQERSRLQAILDNSPVLISFRDMQDRVVLANKAIFETIEVPPPEEFIGRSIFDSFPRQVAETLYATDLEAMKQDVPVQAEETIQHRDGTWHTYLTTKFPVHDIGTHELLGICAISTDITDRKAAEAKIQHLNAELECRIDERTLELERTNEALLYSNMELQNFAHATAHDLQTPLRSIAGFAQLLQKELDEKDGGYVRELLDLIVGNAKRLQALIESLLAYTRLDAQGLPFEAADLRDVADEVVASLAVLIQETGAEIRCEHLPTVWVDRIQITQLFRNLIENAIKYNQSKPPRIAIASDLQDDEWVFSVADNGVGIDPKHHERIFEIFRRLHTYSQVPGTGIGLALCRRIVERHGGHIWVESRPGEGSTFYFTLPAGNGR